MSNPDFFRTRQARKLLIRYPKFDEAWKFIDHCILESKLMGEPSCVNLDGASGEGKTTLAKAIVNSMPRLEDDAATRIPALYVSVPVGATPNQMAEMMLTKIRAPEPNRGSRIHKTERLVNLLRHVCQVRVIFIDEFHHLFNSETRKTLKNTSEWTKDLVRNVGCTFVTIGIKDRVNTIFESNEQLRRHFSPISFEPFQFNLHDAGSIRLFDNVLEQIESSIGIEFAPELDRYDFLYRFHYGTRGKLAYMMMLVKKSVLIADQERLQDVPLQVLKRVYQSHISTKANISNNPFVKKFVATPIEDEKPEKPVKAVNKRGRKPKKRDISANEALRRN